MIAVLSPQGCRRDEVEQSTDLMIGVPDLAVVEPRAAGAEIGQPRDADVFGVRIEVVDPHEEARVGVRRVRRAADARRR